MTKITEAYRQWTELWFRTYATEAESNSASDDRELLEDTITGELSACLADVACKLKLVHARSEGGIWLLARGVIADVIRDIERLAGGTL